MVDISIIMLESETEESDGWINTNTVQRISLKFDIVVENILIEQGVAGDNEW